MIEGECPPPVNSEVSDLQRKLDTLTRRFNAHQRFADRGTGYPFDED